MRRPNFLIIGTPKGGTTSLYLYLCQHPEVYMSEPKETRFFISEEYEKGLEFYWDNYFKGWKGQKAVGEATPFYLTNPLAAPRIKQHLPEAKLIAILRNPIDRAYAAWWMQVCNGKEKRSFEEVVNQSLQRIRAGDGPNLDEEKGINEPLTPGKRVYYTILEVGYYAQHIQRYLDLFPASQFKITYSEDLRKDPRGVVRDVCNFIGVEPALLATDGTAWNVGMDTSEGAARLFGRFNRFAKWLGLHEVVSLETKEELRKRVASYLSFFGKKPEVSKEIRKVLIGHYYSHNRELEKLTGRDLSHWDR